MQVSLLWFSNFFVHSLFSRHPSIHLLSNRHVSSILHPFFRFFIDSLGILTQLYSCWCVVSKFGLITILLIDLQSWLTSWFPIDKFFTSVNQLTFQSTSLVDRHPINTQQEHPPVDLLAGNMSGSNHFDDIDCPMSIYNDLKLKLCDTGTTDKGLEATIASGHESWSPQLIDVTKFHDYFSIDIRHLWQLSILFT